MQQRLAIEPDRINIGYVGISLENSAPRQTRPTVPTIGFLSQTFRLCLSRGVFSVTFHEPTPHPELSVMTGRVGRDGDHVFSSIWWPARQPDRSRKARPGI